MRNWLRDCTQRVVDSGHTYSSRLVICGVLQEPVLGLMLFNVINIINNGIEFTLSKLEEGAKLCVQ